MYQKKFWKRLAKEATPWARDNLLWGAAVVIMPLLLVYLKDRGAKLDWSMAKLTLEIYAVTITIYFVFHVFRTARCLDDDRVKEISELENRNVTQEDLITKLSCAAPQIDIELFMLILKGRLGEKPTDIFAGITLTLKEPREVSISSFELQLKRNGIPTSALAIEDVERWIRLRTRSHPERGYERIPMSRVPKHLTQRGYSVEGWLHFSFDLLDSQIQDSALMLTVHTPHGSCTSKATPKRFAWHDPETKGIAIKADTPFLGAVPVKYA